MTLTIVLPVFNARDFLEQTLSSIFQNTESKFDIILIDDLSDGETREYVKKIEAPEVDILKVLNEEHLWANANWNKGAMMAYGEYIAILNSDITLSKGWDLPLIKLLKEKTIVCPYEENKPKLDPVIAKTDPRMIKGAAFMFKNKDVEDLFPIPAELKHWCGDNFLADRANEMDGVGFAKESTIRHYYSKSGVTIAPEIFNERVAEDVQNYEELSGRDMSLIRNMFASRA
ncbi:MAG: hypothetical protein DRJ15_16155 [Bacteroidetes bacterium]|nr:MAG: hypothetical protein DRJ15_16155 [Bacteroidota bacterium]